MRLLEALPRELLKYILTLLPNKAIKSLRLTNKALNEASSPHLFPTLYLSCHPLDLQVFQLVVDNPLLATNVRELVIDDTCLAPSLGKWDNYRAMAMREQRFWPQRRKPYFPNDEAFDAKDRQWPQEPKREFYELFINTMKPHRENLARGADIAALQDALPKLTSVRSLVVTNRTADEAPDSGAQSRDSSSPTVKQWRQMGREHKERPPFAPRCDWFNGWKQGRMDDSWARGENLSDELQAMIDDSGRPYTEQEELQQEKQDNRSAHEEDSDEASDNPADNWWPFTRCLARETRGIHIALIALQHEPLQQRLCEFRIDASRDIIRDSPQPDYYQTGLATAIFDPYSSPFPDRLASTLGSCSSLEKLALSISNGYGDTQGAEVLQSGTVGRVLTSMKNLHDMSVEFALAPSWLAVPSDFVYPRLRKLRIVESQVWPRKLMEFIRRHAATLEEVYVEQCTAFHEDVRNVWDEDEDEDEDGEVGDLASFVRDVIEFAGREENCLVLGKVVLDSVMGYLAENKVAFDEGGMVDRWAKGRYSWTFGVDDGLVVEKVVE